MTRQDQINAWWEHKSTIYPFECKLSFTQIAEKRITDTSIYKDTGIDFVSRADGAAKLYRFLTEADLLYFQKLYGATTS